MIWLKVGEKGELTPTVRNKIRQSSSYVDEIVERGDVVYGINTGFGPLCNTTISKKDTRQLQENILRSHSVGVGNAIDSKLAKMMLILKLHNLSFGYSGIREETLERMLFFVDQDMIPVVPEKGSVGASGDLAPLAHLFLPLIGLGKFDWKGERVSADLAYMQLGMTPLKLQAKEGLALINGTQFIAAHAAWAVAGCITI